MDRDRSVLEGIAILDELRSMALDDFCLAIGVEATLISTLVDEGVLEPSGRAPHEWRFSGMCLIRARRALRLKDDFGLDWPGIALVLPLLEEVQELRRRQRILLRRLGA